MKGPPLSIGWEYISELTFDLSIYEKYRKRKRRLRSSFKMPSQTRIETLLNLGFSVKEIERAAQEATIARKQRALTIMKTMPPRPATYNAMIQVLRAKFEKPFRLRKRKLGVSRNKKKLNPSSSIKSIGGSETTSCEHTEQETGEEMSILLSKAESSKIMMDVTKKTSNYDLSFGKTVFKEEGCQKDTTAMVMDNSKYDTSFFQQIDCPKEIVEKKYEGEENLVVLLEDGINFKFVFDDSIFCLPACGFFLQFFKDCS